MFPASSKATVVAFALFLQCSPAWTQEWTRFRGPNGSGVSNATSVPLKWTGEEENWRISLEGVGHSSPVLWGNRIFLTAGDEDSGTRILHCINSLSGELIWSHSFAKSPVKKHKLNSYASSTPVVDSTRAYFCWTFDETLHAAAVNHEGTPQWQVKVGEFRSGHGYGVSPILHDGRLILANEHQGEGELVSLDAASGEVHWRVPRDSKLHYSTPCVYSVPGRPSELIFSNWEQGLTAIDPLTGKTNWESDVFDKSHIESSIGSPFVVGNLVFGTCGWLGHGMQTVAVRLSEDNRTRVAEVFRVERGAPLTTTPVAADGLLFLWADNGIVTCVDVQTGEQHWQKRVGGNYYGSPVIIGKAVYCMSADGKCVVLAASKEYSLHARNDLGEGSHATPAVANGRMYLRTFSKLSSVGGE